MTKYRIAVTAEGTMVWAQMRMMRPYSRMTMVLKPIQRTTFRLTAAAGARSATAFIAAPTLDRRPRRSRVRASARRRFRGASALDQAHEDLLEPVHLVAHGEHLDAECREAREDVVQVLLLGDLDLEGVIVDQRRVT